MNLLSQLGLGNLMGHSTTSLAAQAQHQFNQAYNQYAQQAQNNLYNQQALASIKHQAAQAVGLGRTTTCGLDRKALYD